jgi:serine/threonine-protein phosphatase PP1 catalytic subunit
VTYGFRDELLARVRQSVDVYETVCGCFEALPLCAVVNKEIFCVHGGISEQLITPDVLKSEVPDELVTDLLWSDPRGDFKKFGPSDRNLGHFFSRAALDEFLSKNGLTLLIRAHTFTQRGTCWNFGSDGKCLTVFSSSGYEGRGNFGAVALVGTESDVRTEVFSPMTSDQFSHRRILVPSWALTEGDGVLPPVVMPDVCGRVVF